MKTFLVGAAALAATFTGVLSSASPAQAYGYGAGGHWGGYGYHGWGGYGYHGGWGYRGYGYGYGWAPAVAAGVVAGAALAYPYAYGPPAYYAGPGYYAYYHGCRRHWVWNGWNYRLVAACH